MRYLVVNDNTNGYGEALVGGLRQEGQWADLLDCRIHGIGVYFDNQVFRRLNCGFFKGKALNEIDKRISKEVSEKGIDSIIFLFGSVVISEHSLKWLKENKPGTQLIAWFYDVIDTKQSVDMQKIEGLLHYFDKIYTFSVNDIPHIRKFTSVPVRLLHTFCNNFYKPDPSIEKDIDISFVGSWFVKAYFKNRRKMLRRISCISRDRGWRFVVVGRGGIGTPAKFARDLGWAVGFMRNVRPGPLTHKEINNLYQRSKVVFNCPWDDQKGAYPPRTFEAAGSGTCVVSAYMDGLEELYTPDEIPTFRNLDELEALLLDILSDDCKRERIAMNGRHRTINDHLVGNRARTLLV